jgi:hypothetical protein
MQSDHLSTEEHLRYLSQRVKILEDENIATTNALYEMENRLQSHIDALINYTISPKHSEIPNDIH